MSNSDIKHLAKTIVDIHRGKYKKKASPVTRKAIIRRIEGDTAYVHFMGEGSDKEAVMDETPVSLTISGKPGDTVNVRIENKHAWIVGNYTAPPTDDTTAITARNTANTANRNAKKAQSIALLADEKAGQAIIGNNENAAEMARMVIEFNADIENLQDQVDGNITTWFYTYVPNNSNEPAATWISEGSEATHLGDLFYNTSTGYVYRWMSDGASTPTYSWNRITDSDVTKALADAAHAQDTADSKRRIFVTTPLIPSVASDGYDVGDLWVEGSNGDIKRCAQAKTSSGTYSASDWVLASKYTDDSALNTFINGAFATTVTNLETGISDAQVETFRQDNDPSTSWTAAQKPKHEGDMWYCTKSTDTAHYDRYWIYDGSTWQEMVATPPDDVFDDIDGKATIFTGLTTPSSPSVGDLWFKGVNYPILTYIQKTTSPATYEWAEYNKYTDDSTFETWETNSYKPGLTRVILNTGDDMNNCIAKDHIYCTSQTAVCNSLLHMPTGFPSGELELEIQWMGSNDYLVQRLTCKNNAIRKVYLRTYHGTATGDKFGEWTEEGVTCGTCSTAASTAAKVATVNNYQPNSNQYVAITFTNANTASSPTLSINSGTAYSIMTNGVNAAYWDAGATVNFYFDGTYYQTASTPVYASQVTVGNPTADNVFIGNSAVQIRDGSNVKAEFSGDYATLGGNKGKIKYTESVISDIIPNSHRIVVCKATDEGNGVRNDATLSSRDITSFDFNNDEMAFFNAAHIKTGENKHAEAGIYVFDSANGTSYMILGKSDLGDGSGFFVRTPSGSFSMDSILAINRDLSDLDYDVAELLDDIVGVNLDLTGIHNNIGNIMTAQVAELKKLTNADTYYKMTLEAGNSIGSLLSISSGGIKCSSAGKVLVSAQVQFSKLTDQDTCGLQIRNGTTTAIAMSATKSSSTSLEIAITPRLISVSANDVLYVYADNSNHGGGYVGSANGSSVVANDKLKNYLTVQYVEVGS